MTLDLTEDEATALAKHLGDAIDYARYPSPAYSGRSRPLIPT